MADRFGFQFPKTILPERWFLEGSVTVGASGVATGTLPIWMTSISPTGAANPSGTFNGMYTVVLTDSWNGAPYIGADLQCVATGTVASGFVGGDGTDDNLIVKLVSVDVTTNKRFVLRVKDSTTGTGTTPPNGATLKLFLAMSNNGSL